MFYTCVETWNGLAAVILAYLHCFDDTKLQIGNENAATKRTCLDDEHNRTGSERFEMHNFWLWCKTSRRLRNGPNVTYETVENNYSSGKERN